MSIPGGVRSSISTFDFVTLGSTLSMRAFGRLGGCSVFDFVALGSSFAIRSYGRLGSPPGEQRRGFGESYLNDPSLRFLAFSLLDARGSQGCRFQLYQRRILRLRFYYCSQSNK